LEARRFCFWKRLSGAIGGAVSNIAMHVAERHHHYQEETMTLHAMHPLLHELQYCDEMPAQTASHAQPSCPNQRPYDFISIHSTPAVGRLMKYLMVFLSVISACGYFVYQRDHEARQRAQEAMRSSPDPSPK
jgi:hypothetical protein